MERGNISVGLLTELNSRNIFREIVTKISKFSLEYVSDLVPVSVHIETIEEENPSMVNYIRPGTKYTKANSPPVATL